MIEVIKRVVAEMLNLQAKTQFGTITAYDPTRHNVKVMLQPEGVETGWIPLTTPWVGPNMGVVFGPIIGTACRVDFAGGEPDASIAGGRIFDAKNAPPVVQSGEAAIVHQAGAFVKLTNDGKLSLRDKAGSTVVMNGDGTGTMTFASGLTVNANVQVNGTIIATGDISDQNAAKGTVQHIRDIYDVHTHGNVQNGPGNTSTPSNNL